MQPRADDSTAPVPRGVPLAVNRPTSPLAKPRAWVVVTSLVLGLLAGLVGFVAALRPTPVYQTDTVVQLHQPDVFVDPGSILKLNNLRRRYAALIQTEPIAGVVAEKLDLPKNRVSRSVRAVVTLDALLFYPTVRWRDEDTAVELANAITDQLVAFAAKEQADDRVPVQDRIEMRIIERSDSAGKISPTRKRAFISGLVLGTFALLGSYVVLQYWAHRRRSQ